MGERFAPRIAVVGLGCYYPGATSVAQFWHNIVARRRQFRAFPSSRLSSDYFHDSRATATYGRRGAFVDRFEFDWAKQRIPRQTFESTDTVHWLALHVASQALEFAGYARGDMPTERTGVVVGNTLTGEDTRANTLALRWPFVRRAITSAAFNTGLGERELAELLRVTEAKFSSVFHTPNEDSLAGGLSNTIAGRICNFYDLNGGGYTIDGACSSSLLALANAADRLASGDLDLAIAGGVDISLDPFELVGFARAGALTRRDATVYDRNASGFLPGEGCGFVVLKRLEDAREQGDEIIATLSGWGVSSDGKGGITAPNSDGQALALRRAYARAGYGADRLDFVEGHGTGTTLGDRVELTGIANVVGDAGASPRACGVTSLKSLVGHCKAAAGIGGFIKAAVAVNRRVVPPTAACDEPHELFDSTADNLYPVRDGSVRGASAVVTAGVSAMGFGGINCHVTIQSGERPSPRLAPAGDERALLVAAQDAELFLLSGETPQDLVDALGALRREAVSMSGADLVDCAGQLAANASSRQPATRAALVVSTPEQLATAAARLGSAIESGEPAPIGAGWATLFGCAEAAAPAGLLFPGQGSQQLGMARRLIERFAWARELVSAADGWSAEVGGPVLSEFVGVSLERLITAEEQRCGVEALRQTEVAQPAIALASILWLEFLRRLGVQPVAVGGHSLGELAAFHAAGALDAAGLIQLAAVRGRAMAAPAEAAGTMAAVRCDGETTEEILADCPGYAVIANRNGPQQTVISGEVAAVRHCLARAAERGIGGRELPVSNAFHSAMVAGAAESLRADCPVTGAVGPLTSELLSCVDGKAVRPGVDLVDHFARQICAPVDFIALTAGFASRAELLIEVGPGRALSGLVGDERCTPVESRPGRARDLCDAAARLFVGGHDLDWSQLFAERGVQSYRPARERKFLVGICERPFPGESDSIAEESPIAIELPGEVADEPGAPAPTVRSAAVANGDGRAVLVRLIAERTGFDESSLGDDLRLLDDLNLDSIKAADLIAAAAEAAGAPALPAAELANATIAEVAAAITTAAGDQAESPDSLAIDRWVRTFEPAWRPEEASGSDADLSGKPVLLLGARGCSRANAVVEQLRARGALVSEADIDRASPSDCDAEVLIAVLPPGTPALTSAAVATRVDQLARVVAFVETAERCRALLVAEQDSDGAVVTDGSAGAFLASLYLERAELKVCTVAVDAAVADAEFARVAVRELGAEAGFARVRYTGDGSRLVPEPQVLDPSRRIPAAIEWGPEDVILVSGGGRGITAECALALARATGARMALLGTTRLGSPAAVAVEETVWLFASEGLTARYYSCDVTDPAQVVATVAEIERELGPVTGVIHGAGVNRPRLAHTVSVEEAAAELAPKVLGASYLLQALAQSPLKLVAGLTSIIGVSGMQGNAWYALSNQLLRRLLEEESRRRPEVHCLAIAYGLWAGTGMGERLGSVRALAQSGIGALSVDEGTRRLVDLVTTPPIAPEVVVAAEFRGLDTWRPEPVRARRRRFVETVIAHESGVFASAESEVSLERDPYLVDHAVDGTVLLPAVFGLEAMAQAVALALDVDKLDAVRFENVELERPIVIPPEGETTVATSVEILERTRVGQPLRASCTVSVKGNAPSFRADVVVSAPNPAGGVVERRRASEALGLRPEVDLYGPLLFHGPAFQRISRVWELSEQRVDFDAAAADSDDWILGDPFARDAILQSPQLSVPDGVYLPVAIDALEIRGREHAASYRVETTVIERDDPHLTCHVAVVDAAGRVVEEFEGYRTRRIRERPGAPSVAELARSGAAEPTPRTEQVRAAALRAIGRLGAGITVELALHPGIHALEQAERRELCRPLLSRAAQGVRPAAGAAVGWSPAGRPRLLGSDRMFLSLTHERDVCVAIASEVPVGVDLCAVEHRATERWRGLLNGGGHLLDGLAERESIDVAATRIWAAQEAVLKATQSHPRMTVAGFDRDEVTFSSGEYRVVTVLAGSSGEQFVVAVARRSEQATRAATPPAPRPATISAAQYSGVFDAELRIDDGIPRVALRLPVTFRDASRPDATVPASRLFDWMGTAREICLLPVREQLISDLTSGEFGMVTNEVEHVFLEPASLGEAIELRVAHTGRGGSCGSQVGLRFDWYRLANGDEWRQFAASTMQTSWVRLDRSGLAHAAPLPSYLSTLLAEFTPDSSELPTGEPESPRPAYLRKNLARTAPAAAHQFATDYEEGNGVGNVYFSNYSKWMSRLRDRFVHGARPSAARGEARAGLSTVRSRISHLREALPFDDVRVEMRVQARWHDRVELAFDYFRVGADRMTSKLATATETATWRTGSVSEPLPTWLVRALEAAEAKKEEKEQDEPQAII